ncbi:MAG TPA: transcription termination factor NusA [Candidatus Paceibacterota bacterium]|nr:transcription termination factor NusA [Candidatus Paceibacterota bacterium]
MFDLKTINSVLAEMEEERGISREKMLDAIAQSLATAYKKEFGKRGQVIRANFDLDTGTTTFEQVKLVVDESMLKPEPEATDETEDAPVAPAEEDDVEDDGKVRFDEEKHMLIDTARMIKKDVAVGEELVFPLEGKDDFGRIAAQTAKQVIIQKIREAEKESALAEFGQKAGDIVMGHVQRFERGNLYVDLGRVTAIMPYEEQIPGERFRPGERIRALLLEVDETARGVFLKLSRAHADFLAHLFAVETPELQSGTVEVKAIAREAGSRSKIAVFATDTHIDPVGSLVGQRGVRVSTVMSELGGEKIDIIEWSDDPLEFIEDALSPAQVLEVRVVTEPNDEAGERGHVEIEVAPDQQSLAIGRGGQNVRLAAKLTGWKIDIVSVGGEQEAVADGDEVVVAPDTEIGKDIAMVEGEDATTDAPAAAPSDDVERNVTDAPVDAADETESQDRDARGLGEEEEVDTPEEAEALVNEAAIDEIAADAATDEASDEEKKE